MIETKTYNLTKERYSEIVIKKRLKKTWWIIALMLLVSILNLNNFGKDNFSTFIVIFGFAYPLITFIYLYFWTRSKNHDVLFETMNMSFDNSNLYLKRSGNESKIPFININKCLSKKGFWMLYIQQGNFLYIPKDIFYTTEDFNSFRRLLNTDE